MYVVVVNMNGKTKYFVEETKNVVRYSETIGEWTPLFSEKMAQKVAKKLAKKFHLIDVAWVEKVA